MEQSWDTSYKAHSIWGTLEAAQRSLTETDVPISDPRSVAFQELLASIEAHKQTPDILITQASLDSAETCLRELHEELPENFDTVFSGTNSLFERLASAVRDWPVTGSMRLTGFSHRIDELTKIFAASEDAVTVRTKEVIANQSKTVSEALSGIEKDVAQFKSRLSDLRERDVNDAELVRTNISKNLEALSNELNAANASAVELRERIAAQDKRLDEASVDRAEKFAAETAERYSEWESIKADVFADIATSRDAMEDAEKESRNVLARIGVNITSGDYGAYASEQERAANLWRILATVAFLLAGGLFIAFALAPLFGGGLHLEWWEYAFQRLGTPVGIAGVAIYMARESSLHREQQRIAKQAHLTLTTLEPFIANLPSGERSEIRGETARRLFAKSENVNQAANSSQRENVFRMNDRSSDG